ncbi:uncharacterized protein DS421_20g692860 [Arachis hypogaea]|nr:uncharacterized protein DS421_20g692860 [Arachis hypogaea]
MKSIAPCEINFLGNAGPPFRPRPWIQNLQDLINHTKSLQKNAAGWWRGALSAGWSWVSGWCCATAGLLGATARGWCWAAGRWRWLGLRGALSVREEVLGAVGGKIRWRWEEGFAALRGGGRNGLAGAEGVESETVRTEKRGAWFRLGVGRGGYWVRRS